MCGCKERAGLAFRVESARVDRVKLYPADERLPVGRFVPRQRPLEEALRPVAVVDVDVDDSNPWTTVLVAMG